MYVKQRQQSSKSNQKSGFGQGKYSTISQTKNNDITSHFIWQKQLGHSESAKPIPAPKVQRSKRREEMWVLIHDETNIAISFSSKSINSFSKAVAQDYRPRSRAAQGIKRWSIEQFQPKQQIFNLAWSIIQNWYFLTKGNSFRKAGCWTNDGDCYQFSSGNL